MEIKKISEVNYFENSAISVGTYDGVHIAHQAIIKRTVSEAKKMNGRSVIVTFDPHPREVITEGKVNLRLLTTLEERKCLCDKYGIDLMVVISFTKEFAQINFRDFMTEYLIKRIGLKVIVEGYGYHWGKNREGNIDSLIALGKEYNFEVINMDKFIYEDEPVSSSKIRNILEAGNVESAMKLLGRPYSIQGKVVVGNRRGRLLGYPTANIKLNYANKLVPLKGIYFSKVCVDDQMYFGMTSIGTRPTFEKDGEITIEVNIMDFNKEIYDKEIKIEFLRRLRDERKFDSVDKLVEQMNIDRIISKKLQLEYEK